MAAPRPAPGPEVDVRVAGGDWRRALARPRVFVADILAAASAAAGGEGAVSVLLADSETLRILNRQWRGKDKPTNILSFPAPAGSGSLGDLALAWEVVAREADEQGKPVSAHAAHLLVHGYLHLLGYDHEEEPAAEAMEARERSILAGLGLPDPYA